MSSAMQKFTSFLIVLIIPLVFSLSSFAWIMPTGSILQVPSLQIQPLQVPAFQYPSTGEGDILIDSFEYWDSPYNHGWVQTEPPYPVYGFGIGYALYFNTILDIQEGSRVLDVYRPSSLFLLGTPYTKHGIYYNLYTPSVASSTSLPNAAIDLSKNPILCFKFRAPLGIEPWDIFTFDIIGVTRAGYRLTLQIKPISAPEDSYINRVASTDNMGDYTTQVVDFNQSVPSIAIEVKIGRGYLDGAWHIVWLNLVEVAQKALENYKGGFAATIKTDWEIARVERLFITGRMFRLDDIMFRTGTFTRIDQPDMIEPGPLFAQLFEPYRYLFFSEYEALGEIKLITDFLLDPDNFIIEHEKIRDIWIADLLRLDPNYHVIDPNHPQYDPNYTRRWSPLDPNFGMPDPVAERYIREGFFIDGTLPLFSDQNLRIGGNRMSEVRNHGHLGWNMTIGGYGQNGIQTSMLHLLPINPYDGMPTYFPTYYQTIAILRTFGTQHYSPSQTFALESSLWNIGMDVWPNVIYMDYEPQTFEDMIVTLEVTNGSRSDVRTFPISVVNYPVENYPPVIQLHTSNRIFYFGQENYYALRFIDPDCYHFSLAQFMGKIPATTHLPMLPGNQIRKDQENFIFKMTLDGAPAYQYGPWMQQIIDPHNGLISFTPQFEGAFRATVTCMDDKGGQAFGSFTIYTVNTGTWLNHPPINFGNTTRPWTVKAGEEIFITAPDLKVIDLDGDELYATCNIGSVGRTDDGGFLWCFQSNFPGFYSVEIIFYDLRGGYLVIRVPLDVKPWWSY